MEDRAEYDAMARNVDATMQAMGQLTHYGLSSVLVTAGADRPDADKISEFTLKAMAVKGMIPGIKSVGGTLTRGIESIVRDYEIVYNPYVYSSGGFGSLTVNKKLPTTAPNVAEATVSEAPVTSSKVFDPTKIEVVEFKKSNFQKGDNIGLHRFTQRIDGNTWKDPKSGQFIQKEQALNSGAGPHGPSRWKLYDFKEKRLGSISEDGKWMRD